MKAKEYLMQYRLMKEHLNDLERQIEDLNAEAEAVRIKLDDMPRGSNLSDRTAKLAVSIADLTMKSINTRDSILLERDKISDTLRALNDRMQFTILYKRYIEGERWEEIAVETGYTYRSVTRIHGRALESVQKLLDESTL